jgi:MoaA/NifB/PqqE/SkfB family radical SAM enzyme
VNRPGSPLFATINVTGRCNLACPYCFMTPRPRGVMAPREFRRVVDELAAGGVFFVNVSGGEPFTHPEIGAMLRHAHRRFSHVVTLTNGTALGREHFRVIREIASRKGGFPVQVSLDAADARTNERTRGHTERVRENIARLVEVGANVVVAMVVTRHNVSTLADSVRELSRHTRFFHLMPFQPVRAKRGRDASLAIDAAAWPALWNELVALRATLGLHFETPLDDRGILGCAEGAPCMAAFTHLVIDPDLRVRPCDRLVDVVIGDLRTASVADVWRSAAAREVVERATPLCEEPWGGARRRADPPGRRRAALT